MANNVRLSDVVTVSLLFIRKKYRKLITVTVGRNTVALITVFKSECHINTETLTKSADAKCLDLALM